MGVNPSSVMLADWLIRPFSGSPGPSYPPNPLPVQHPATPLPQGLQEIAYDGTFLGGDKRAYAASTPLARIPPFAPQTGPVKPGLILWINGLWEDCAKTESHAQQVADATHRPVIAIHSATKGFFKDIFQDMADRFDWWNNRAVDVLKRLILESVLEDKDIFLAGHSHGAGDLSRAAIDLIKADPSGLGGLTQAEFEQRMKQHVHVVTLAGSASYYPDQVDWRHVVNQGGDASQWVSFYFFGNNPPNPLVHQGESSRSSFFHTWNPFTAHDVQLYLEHTPESFWDVGDASTEVSTPAAG